MQRQLPPPLPTISSVHDVPAERTAIHVLKRGDPDRKGKPVGMRVPGAALTAKTPELPPPTRRTHERVLAAWINDPDNPLAARVWVNRVWQYHFGQGIVATRQRFRRQRQSRPAIPNCSTTWPMNFSPAVGVSSRCIG